MVSYRGEDETNKASIQQLNIGGRQSIWEKTKKVTLMAKYLQDKRANSISTTITLMTKLAAAKESNSGQASAEDGW